MKNILISVENNEQLKAFESIAKVFGSKISMLNNEQYEDFLLGAIISKEKSGKLKSKEAVLNKLKK
jgi:hypothetical protein